MDSFQLLKRRTTDLLNSINLGGTHHHHHRHQHARPSPQMKGTWEKISGLPPLDRSSHSLNIVAGTVYIFGGESNEGGAREPVDNDMHIIMLPFGGGASADYYVVKAKAAARTEPALDAGGQSVGGDDGEGNTELDPAAGERDFEAVSPIELSPRLDDSGHEGSPLGSPGNSVEPPLDDFGGSPLASPPGSALKSPGFDQSPLASPGNQSEPPVEEFEGTPLASPGNPDDAPVDEFHGTPLQSPGNPDDLPPDDAATSPLLSPGAAPSLGDVPAPRVGHATAVIGHRIFLFGGRGGPEMTALDEGGRVWVFDTRTRLWSYLDPIPPRVLSPISPESPASQVNIASTVPEPRSYHAAVASDKPREFNQAPRSPHHIKPLRRADTWRDWAAGNTEEFGTPQRPIVGAVAERATDADAEGYGTLIIHGGCLSSGGRGNDVWAFDVHSCTWQRLPDAPGPSRGGPALALSRNRLYRFGGFDGEDEIGGQLDYLELGVDTFDDGFSAGEVALSVGRGGGEWKSLLEGKEDVGYKESDPADAPLTGPDADDPWPAPRSVTRLEAVTVGGGREYLVLMFGEGDPSGVGHEGAGSFYDDVWAFQVPSQQGSAASFADTVLSVVGRKTGEGRWARVITTPHDDEDDESVPGPVARGWFASAPMGSLEENGIAIWGGLNVDNQRLGDGWILRLG